MPLFRALNLQKKSITIMPTAPSYQHPQTQKVHTHVTTSTKFQINIDLEFVLDRTRDWLDYKDIIESFNKRWEIELAPFKT